MTDAPLPSTEPAPELPPHGAVGRGRERVHFVAAVMADGTIRDHPGDLIPFVNADDVPAPRAPRTEPRRTSAGF
jgi:hypothetical protein